MTGKHLILIESARIKYRFEIKRNLTIIQGDSATGKTTLIDLLTDYAREPENGPVQLQSDVPCTVYSGDENNWKHFLEYTTGSIVFFDEGYSFIRTREFADRIRHTDNYYVLITREALPNLPYSIHEIYGIRTSGKYHFPEPVYHEFYPLYEECSGGFVDAEQQPLVLCEDSHSGYEFLKESCQDAEVVSAEGNSNILRLMKTIPNDRKLIVLADGAAFGAFVGQVLSVAGFYKKAMLYFPESFEWLILKSGILPFPELNMILEHPEDYIESSRYFSWEQFFAELLEQRTAADPIRRYHKTKLAAFYLEGRNRVQILAVFPKEIRTVIGSL